MALETLTLNGISLKVVGVEKNTDKGFNYDSYYMEARGAMATREISMIVDFDKQEVSGDIVAFGEWGKLDSEEIEEILEQLIASNEILRPIDFSYKEGRK